MDNTAKWIIGGCVGVLSIIVLYVASRGHESVLYYGGLAVFVACVLFDMYLIKRSFDQAERRGPAEHTRRGDRPA